MAGINPVGQAGSYIIGRGIGSIAGRASPFLPSFYNSRYTDPRQALQNSEAAQLARGNRRSWRNFLGRKGGGIAGGLLGGPIGYIAGSYLVPHILNAVNGEGWNGDKLPTPSVNVGDIASTPEAMQALMDSWGSGYVPSYSNYGPYASGYMGLPSTPSNDVTLPSFSDYGSQFTTPQAGEQYAPINDDAPGGGYSYSGGGYSGGGGMSGSIFSGGNTWGGGTSGAMLSNLGLASGVETMGVPLGGWQAGQPSNDAFGDLGGLFGHRVVYVAK